MTDTTVIAADPRVAAFAETVGQNAWVWEINGVSDRSGFAILRVQIPKVVARQFVVAAMSSEPPE